MPDLNPVEDGVTVESLGSALDDLVKAAETTDLLKGDPNRVEHSGRVDEDGKGGGGRTTNTGGIDKMMIGKLEDLGFNAGDIATMSGALAGKAKDEEDDDDSMEGYVGKMIGHAKAYADGNGGSMKGYPGFKKSGDAGEEPLHKSGDVYGDDPVIAEFVDGNEFFKSYVARTAEQIDAVNGSLQKGFGNQSTINSALAGAMHQMGTLIKSRDAVIDELGKRLGIVESVPNAPKGVTTADAAMAKSMPGEAGNGQGEPLTKSEICSTLTYMNLVKGIREIDGQRTADAVGMLEGGNQASEAVLKAVDDFHRTNPALSEAARTHH